MGECIDEAGISNKMRPGRSEWHAAVTFAHDAGRDLAEAKFQGSDAFPLVVIPAIMSL